MALVILTDAQKDLLQNDNGFISECKWGILNKAAYWKGLDGTAVPGGQTSAGLAQWRKSYDYAAQISANPSIAENQLIVKSVLMYLKSIPCVDSNISSQFTSSNSSQSATVVAQLLADSRLDAAADNWFNIIISTVY